MNQLFDNDIALCDLQSIYPDVSCPKQTSCHRYLQNQRCNSEYSYKVLINPDDITEDGCRAYWEEK